MCAWYYLWSSVGLTLVVAFCLTLIDLLRNVSVGRLRSRDTTLSFWPFSTRWIPSSITSSVYAFLYPYGKGLGTGYMDVWWKSSVVWSQSNIPENMSIIFPSVSFWLHGIVKHLNYIFLKWSIEHAVLQMWYSWKRIWTLKEIEIFVLILKNHF